MRTPALAVLDTCLAAAEPETTEGTTNGLVFLRLCQVLRASKKRVYVTVHGAKLVAGADASHDRTIFFNIMRNGVRVDDDDIRASLQDNIMRLHFPVRHGRDSTMLWDRHAQASSGCSTPAGMLRHIISEITPKMIAELKQRAEPKAEAAAEPAVAESDVYKNLMALIRSDELEHGMVFAKIKIHDVDYKIVDAHNRELNYSTRTTTHRGVVQLCLRQAARIGRSGADIDIVIGPAKTVLAANGATFFDIPSTGHLNRLIAAAVSRYVKYADSKLLQIFASKYQDLAYYQSEIDEGCRVGDVISCRNRRGEEVGRYSFAAYKHFFWTHVVEATADAIITGFHAFVADLNKAQAAADPDATSRLWENIVNTWQAHVLRRGGSGEHLKVMRQSGKSLFLIPFEVEDRHAVFLFSPTETLDRNKDHYSLRLDARGRQLIVEASTDNAVDFFHTTLRSLPGDNGLVAFIAFLRQRGVLQKVFEGVHKANS